VFDVKGDFGEALAGFTNVSLLAPWDERGLRWDIRKEVQHAKDCELLASAMVYSSEGGEHQGKEEFFAKQARLVFQMTLHCLLLEGQLSWANLAKYTTSIDMLVGEEVAGEWVPGLLQKYEIARPAWDAIGRGSDQTQGTWTTLQDSVGKWVHDAAAAFSDTADWSFSEWIQSGENNVNFLILSFKKHTKTFPKRWFQPWRRSRLSAFYRWLNKIIKFG